MTHLQILTDGTQNKTSALHSFLCALTVKIPSKILKHITYTVNGFVKAAWTVTERKYYQNENIGCL